MLQASEGNVEEGSGVLGLHPEDGASLGWYDIPNTDMRTGLRVATPRYFFLTEGRSINSWLLDTANICSETIV